GPPNGTAFTRFLSGLNGGDYYDRSVELVFNSNPASCFAHHCDWRLPSIVELIELVDSIRDNPGITSILGPRRSAISLGTGPPLRTPGRPDDAWLVYNDGERTF